MARSKSGSRSSRSRTPSRSRSRSFSKSRSRSRSLSHPRKRRHSSRSRSRSYSPSHNRERNYPRVYQNRDNFRGNNRGYRRPYYFRNRGGRGFYPRGQYNRGGYVNYNRPNWQNYNRQPYSPRRGRSRSRTPKRRSPSPRSRSHSRNSDKSSSDRSRRSSSSKSSSSNPSIVESSKRKSRKEKKTRSKDKRASLQTTGEDDSKETSLSGGGEPNSKAETSKDWQDISYDTSPIAQHSPERAPTLKSSVQSVVVRRSPRSNPLQKSPPSPQGGAPPSGSSFRALSRQSPFDHNTSGMSPPKKAPLSKTSPTISSLYGNPKDEGRPGDAGPYSKRYLEDLKTKASDLDRDAGKDKESKMSSLEKMKDRGSPSDFAMNELEKAYRSSQSPKRYKMREDFDKIKMAEFHKEKRYGKDDADDLDKKVPVRSRKDSDFDNDAKPLSKAFASSNKNLDPYDPGKWEEIKFPKDKHRKSEELDDDDDEEDDEDLFPPERSKKEERATAKRADQAQKASVPDKNFRVTSFKAVQEKNAASPPRKTSEVREREKVAARDMAFAKSTFCISRETGSSIRIDSFDEDLARPSGMLAHERKLSRDLVHTNKKEADFRSIFQHIQSAQPQRSPSELFAQHIVTIVHHVKEHHFGPGGMTLNERFTKYLKKGADQEPTKSKKSPEIHRRIDISPTAFRKGFAQEEAKISKESGNKAEGKYKDEPVEIERRKKHKEHKRGRSRESPDSRDSSRSRERSVEKPTKSRKGSKKHKKHRKMRERSPSPSSTASSRSPSSHSFRGGEEGLVDSEEKEESSLFDKSRLSAKDHTSPNERGRARGNFQYRARGRGWGRGTFTGSSNDFKNRSKDEEWDPEFAPKNKKYYVKKNAEHDEREGENEDKWANRGRGRGAFSRGRGRFLFRKPGNSPKWSHDKFSGEEGEIEDESGAETRDEKSNSISAAD
ncbi:thyroid hormone receptor-associated protein 3 isoform X2 [Pleurodeles waltl]|uniref:thyroid hormone receptor-associated protein 3 isoform X2 n=1 Tax=Pleurodeles waltl TaxID=8319 RepID=UPI003709887C